MKIPDLPKTNEQPIVIQDASPEDAAEIVRIQAETWLATYPNAEHGITREDIEAEKLGDPKRIARWQTFMKKETTESKIWIAKDGNRIVGYCFAKKGEKENYIEALYVSPQEQHKGIGQTLMAEVLSWLGEDKPIGLGVASYNTQAIAFYKKLGFEVTDEAPAPVPPLRSGKVLPVIKMVRRIKTR